jgi:hypothetical protein
VPAFSALGFVAGTFLPSRFTAPLAAIAAFFILGFSTELITGSQSYWQVSPVVTGPWDLGPQAGVATFYPFVPDLSIAQVMFLAGLTAALLGTLALPAGSARRSLRAAGAGLTTAGLLAAGTAVWLAGTGTMDRHGMIDIPALHDAASDQPIRFTPVCTHASIPVCLNPAYSSYLAVTAAALEPVLAQIAGLPGAPARILQQGELYLQGSGNDVQIASADPARSATLRVYRLLLPDQQPGPAMTAEEMSTQIRSTDGAGIAASFTGDGPGASQAQDAIAAALIMAAGQHGAGGNQEMASQPGPGPAPLPGLTPGPAHAAAERFAALPAPVRHAWLADHLAALRAGQITLAQLP